MGKNSWTLLVQVLRNECLRVVFAFMLLPKCMISPISYGHANVRGSVPLLVHWSVTLEYKTRKLAFMML